MKTILIRMTLCSVLCFTALFSGQTAGEESNRFRTIGGEIAPDDLYYDFKGAHTKISVIESARSAFHEFAKAENISIYRLIPGADGTTAREEVAVADIANAGTRPLLVFLKHPDPAKPFKIVAVADDIPSFPFPSTRFMNFTDLDLAIEYGKDAIKVARQSIELFNSKSSSTEQPQTRYITVKTTAPPASRLLYSNNWVVRPSQRTLVLILPQEDGVKILRIADEKTQ